MNEVKKIITCLQYNLNKRLYTTGVSGCKTSSIYLLSAELDKEIVKYYKTLTNH